MIVVTGGAGFIGSNLVRALNQRGERDVLVVDDMRDGRKFQNLVDCEISDLLDKDDFLENVLWSDDFEAVDAIFHQGACSNTLEWDGQYILNENYEYSKTLLRYCEENQVPFIYASSAAVYGAGTEFREDAECERPLNPYGYSKLLLDRFADRRRSRRRCQIVGLRYFNVYGPGEAHKGEMASVAYKHHQQLRESGRVKLFEGSDGFRRDFVWVGDVVDVNLWFQENPDVSGVFNVGTGRAQPFTDVARAVIAHHGRGEIEWIPMPEELRGHYQTYTQADVSRLREVGYERSFLPVEQGVAQYLKELG